MAELRTVHRALDVLEALAAGNVPMGTTELAARLRLPKATAHRLISTLTSRGYLTQDPNTSKYWLGLRCLELGMQMREHLDLRGIAQPYLRQLSELTREVIHLAIYDRGDVIYIDKLDSLYPVSPQSRVGLRAPSYAVATGRALLAYQSSGEIEAVLQGPLTRYTKDTVTDPNALRDLLKQVRAVGYATNTGSWREDVCGIAAPIRNYTGSVIASVGCCVPAHRFGTNGEALRAPTLAAARLISEAFGYVGDEQRMQPHVAAETDEVLGLPRSPGISETPWASD